MVIFQFAMFAYQTETNKNKIVTATLTTMTKRLVAGLWAKPI